MHHKIKQIFKIDFFLTHFSAAFSRFLFESKMFYSDKYFVISISSRGHFWQVSVNTKIMVFVLVLPAIVVMSTFLFNRF